MRYHFQAVNADLYAAAEGVECVDLQDARRHAVLYAANVLREQPGQLENDELRVEVMDHEGLLVTTMVILSIDAKGPDEIIDVSRRAYTATDPEPVFVTGSGHASRKQRALNR